MRNNQLFNGSLIFFLLIIGALTLGFITNKTKSWKVSNSEVQAKINSEDFVIEFYDFNKLLKSQGDNVLIVDLRSAENFKKAHIKNAINHPAESAFEKNVLKELRNSEKQIIICAESQSDASLYLMMYSSMGIENVKVLAGNPEMYLQWSETKDPALNYFNEEKMRWNYRNLIKQDEAAPATDVKPMMNRAKGGC
ncbi:MAG: rhodanese-like domain-containing protein [Bacteroidales bacterium]|jgi:rhodanese-related sulfurtransferase|nr:rhodanese-like domain-containing protein [Bacteroidales bacterium]